LALTVALPEFVDHLALEFVVRWAAPDRFEALLISEVDVGQISQKRLEQGQDVRGINLIRNALRTGWQMFNLERHVFLHLVLVFEKLDFYMGTGRILGPALW
jgi:hypothetical protein